mgnify:CR=1 FL=1
MIPVTFRLPLTTKSVKSELALVLIPVTATLVNPAPLPAKVPVKVVPSKVRLELS